MMVRKTSSKIATFAQVTEEISQIFKPSLVQKYLDLTIT
jgi:hypothetical protein